MKTSEVRSLALGPGLVNGGMRYTSSMCHADGSDGLNSPTVVESFTVHAQDGSEFLVTITRLRKEKEQW